MTNDELEICVRQLAIDVERLKYDAEHSNKVSKTIRYLFITILTTFTGTAATLFFESFLR